jgi:trimethylamine--corrinoid protein Co-methyltransferase
MGAEAALRRLSIAPLRSDFALRLHDDAYLDRFTEAALEILGRTGVRVLSEEGLSVLAEHGCPVEGERQLARIPAEVALGALRRAPRHFVLGSRDGSCDIDLADGFTYTSISGCGSEVIDWRTGQRRASTKADVADVTRLADYLSSIGFWWPLVGAGDCGTTAQLHELDAGWNNTVKHLQGFVQGGREARYAVERATVVAGDGARLRARPNLSDLVFAVSPLVLDRDGVEAALVFAKAGVPVCVGSGPAVGTTGPAMLAGTYAQALAEVIAYATLIQCAHPGAPVIGYVVYLYSDPRTGAPVGS